MSKKIDLNELLNAVENKNKDDINILQKYLGEYLKTYFLVGYDHEESGVLIINGKTEQDFDSIECLVNRFHDIKFQSPEQFDLDKKDEK